MTNNLSPAQTALKAVNKALATQDLDKFEIAIKDAQPYAKDDPGFSAKLTYLAATGYVHFQKYDKALQYVPTALEINSGTEVLHVKLAQARSLGQKGEIEKALELYYEVANSDIADISTLVDAYNGITWIYTIICRHECNSENLLEMKKYLDLAFQYFENISDRQRQMLFSNYGIYYYLKDDFALSIEKINEAIKYSDDQSLSQLYINLAEVYLGSDAAGVSEMVYDFASKAETLSEKNRDDFSMALSHYLRGIAELLEDQFFTGLDTLYVAFEYLKTLDNPYFTEKCLNQLYQILDGMEQMDFIRRLLSSPEDETA